MGFFRKLINWATGKGFKEETTTPISYQKEKTRIEPTSIPKDYKKEATIPKEEIRTQKPTTREKTEIEIAEERLKIKPSRATTERKIKPEVTNQQRLTGMTDGTGMKEVYTRLFTDNAKLEDPDILQLLVEHRAELKHRFVTHYEINYEKGVGGTIEIMGLLPEIAPIIHEYIREGMILEYPKEDLTIIAETIKQASNAIDSTTQVLEENRFKITGIEIRTTFA